MLVLSRKINEVIEVGDNVTITIVDFRHDNVRIGIEAPPETPIYRREVAQRIRQGLPAPSPSHDRLRRTVTLSTALRAIRASAERAVARGDLQTLQRVADLAGQALEACGFPLDLAGTSEDTAILRAEGGAA